LWPMSHGQKGWNLLLRTGKTAAVRRCSVRVRPTRVAAFRRLRAVLQRGEFGATIPGPRRARRYVRRDGSHVRSSRMYRAGDRHHHLRRAAPHRVAEPARRSRGLLRRRPVSTSRRAPASATELGAARHPSPARQRRADRRARAEPVRGARTGPAADAPVRAPGRPPGHAAAARHTRRSRRHARGHQPTALTRVPQRRLTPRRARIRA